MVAVGFDERFLDLVSECEVYLLLQNGGHHRLVDTLRLRDPHAPEVPAKFGENRVPCGEAVKRREIQVRRKLTLGELPDCVH